MRKAPLLIAFYVSSCKPLAISIKKGLLNMLNMTNFFAVRNLDDATKEFISNYAREHKLSMAEAMREIALLAQKKMQEKKGKRSTSVFSAYEKIKFSSGNPNLSREIDTVLYGKRKGGHDEGA